MSALIVPFLVVGFMLGYQVGKRVGVRSGRESFRTAAFAAITGEVVSGRRWRRQASDAKIALGVNTHEAEAHWEGANRAASIVLNLKVEGESMKKIVVLSIVALGLVNVAAWSQKPAATPAKPAAEAVKPAATPAAPAKPVDAATVKSLKDALSIFQLDQLAVQTAQNTASQTDAVAKRAMQVLNEALAASPEVRKAQEQLEADRKALLDKIEVLRKQQGLDQSWDWDFNQNKFVQTKPPAPGPVKNG